MITIIDKRLSATNYNMYNTESTYHSITYYFPYINIYMCFFCKMLVCVCLLSCVHIHTISKNEIHL